jgi:hypothetical protein
MKENVWYGKKNVIDNLGSNITRNPNILMGELSLLITSYLGLTFRAV